MLSIYPESRQKPGTGDRFFDHYARLSGASLTPFSCGRAAMLFTLRALGVQRMEEILVPPFMCWSVLATLVRTAFPAMEISSRTRAILVFHQFGFPQNLEAIQALADAHGYVILSDSAHTLFSSRNGRSVVQWGHVAIVSLAKLFPCTLGGGLWSEDERVLAALASQYDALRDAQQGQSDEAYDRLVEIGFPCGTAGHPLVLESLYGYLPNLVAFPGAALGGLPSSEAELVEDADRRRRLWEMVSSVMPDRVPRCSGSDVVPFAVPVMGEPEALRRASALIMEQYDTEVPILHFDFACNMLEPDYREALVIGCHAEWTEELVTKICRIIADNVV